MSGDRCKRCPNIAWAFWNAKRLGLPGIHRAVYIAIAERADSDLRCHPTHAQLADDSGFSERSVYSAVKALAASGLIEVEARVDGSHYRLIREAETASAYDWSADSADSGESHDVRDAPDPISQEVREVARTGCEMYNDSPLDSPLSTFPNGNAPIDAKERLWTEGITLVRQLIGLGEGRARGFLGKLVKEARDDADEVMGLLIRCQRERPGGDDPRGLSKSAWLIAGARALGGKGFDPSRATGAAALYYELGLHLDPAPEPTTIDGETCHG
jgi:hypothetical protein